MTIKFLLFRGNWENEGKFYALESEKAIILLATGQDYSVAASTEQQLGYDYLKENRNKIQGIIINNTTENDIVYNPTRVASFDLDDTIIAFKRGKKVRQMFDKEIADGKKKA